MGDVRVSFYIEESYLSVECKTVDIFVGGHGELAGSKGLLLRWQFGEGVLVERTGKIAGLVEWHDTVEGKTRD